MSSEKPTNAVGVADTRGTAFISHRHSTNRFQNDDMEKLVLVSVLKSCYLKYIHINDEMSMAMPRRDILRKQGNKTWHEREQLGRYVM